MMQTILYMFTYPFIVRAFVVGILVSLCASLLGTSLVLKRYSMIGDGLSHVGFAALTIAYPLGVSPLYVSIPICVATAFFLLQIEDSAKIKGDAATALMCSSALAIGVMVISLTTGMNTDVCNYMFGSILAMSGMDVWISVILSIIVLLLYGMFYHRIFAVTFDENFAKATGIHTKRYNMIIASLTAVTVVLGMRMMGTLLISSLIVFPSLTAMRVCRRFRTTVVMSAVLAVISFMAGLIFSYLHSVPTGACIVLADLILFLAFRFVEALRERG